MDIYEESIEAFNEVLKLNPKNEFALTIKGSALYLLERYEEAIEVLNKALEPYPENKFALLNKAYTLVSLERYEESIVAFNKILEINPEDGSALVGKGSSLVSLENYEEAIEVFNKARNLTSDELLNIESTFRLIEVYISLNRINEATIELEPIKETIYNKDPNITEEFIDLCWNLAFEELKLGNLGNAKNLIRTIFDLEVRLEKEIFEVLMMKIFKRSVDFGEFEVLKTVIDEITEIKDGKCPELLKPFCKAVEIVETKDIRNYYKLQVEEREIVAEIVQKISKSEDLLPPEYKKR